MIWMALSPTGCRCLSRRRRIDMKKITIEIPDNYDDVLCLTFIGHGGGFDRNVTVSAIDLEKITGHHAEYELICINGDITNCKVVQKGNET